MLPTGPSARDLETAGLLDMGGLGLELVGLDAGMSGRQNAAFMRFKRDHEEGRALSQSVRDQQAQIRELKQSIKVRWRIVGARAQSPNVADQWVDLLTWGHVGVMLFSRWIS